MTTLPSGPDDRARRFLIACLGSPRMPSLFDEARRAAADGPLDWRIVEALAVEEKVAPLIYRATRDHDLLPDWLADGFRRAYVETGLINKLRLEDLAVALDRLAARRIDTIVLKGVALAHTVYGNIALRPMIDVDLLVRRDRALDALDVLRECGYRPDRDEIMPAALLTYENELFLRKRDRLEWHLELHWSLFDSPYHQTHLPESDLWATSVPLMVEGAPTRVLSPDLMLLHLCGHLVLHHRNRGLLWQYDIVELLHHERERIDWDVVLERAAAMKLILPLKSVLPELAEVWGAPVPAPVLAQLAAARPDRVEARVFRAQTTGRRSVGPRLIDDLIALPSWAARVRFLWANLFPPAAYMDERYGIGHPALRAFYYPYRWALGILSFFTRRR